MSWNLIKEIFPAAESYNIKYQATDYQKMAIPYHRNSVIPEGVFKIGDVGIVDLEVILIPGTNSSPMAPNSLLKSLVPNAMIYHLKGFESIMTDGVCRVKLNFIFQAGTFDQSIMTMYKASFEQKFTEELENELVT